MSLIEEHPILFNGEMVLSLLSGRKTQTRRVVNPQPNNRPTLAAYGLTVGADPAKDGSEWIDGDCINSGSPMKCPYGKIGDLLWVRETWATDCVFDQLAPSDIPEDSPLLYTADDDATGIVAYDWGKKRPSIFMLRWASRIILEVVDVRAERVDTISEVDAKAEGVTAIDCVDLDDSELELMDLPLKERKRGWKYRNGFSALWDSINRKQGFGWDANPWVWVIEFKVIEVKGGQS